MPTSVPSTVWRLEGARLPKAVESDPRAPALHAALREHCRKLWSDGAILVPTAAWSAAVEVALGQARRDGHLLRGLESADTALQREARGLSMTDARSETQRGARVSRLLLVSGDGTERFYRQVEGLVCKHSPRVLPVVTAASSGQLSALVESPGVVRALMLEHKDSVARVLFALYASP